MSKPKIVVLRMRELIYTMIFAVLILALLVLLFFMFRPKENVSSPLPERERTQTSDTKDTSSHYTSGVYAASLALNNQPVNVEVVLSTDRIQHIRLVNLGESAAASVSLAEPSLDELSQQICQKQSLDGITCSLENKYTSELLFQAIKNSLAKAQR